MLNSDRNGFDMEKKSMKEKLIEGYEKLSWETKKIIFGVVITVLGVGMFVDMMMEPDTPKKSQKVVQPMKQQPVIKEDTAQERNEPLLPPEYLAQEEEQKEQVQESEVTPVTEPAVVTTQYREHIVQKKESLYSIAKDTYGDSHYWVLIYEHNKAKIKDPDKIYAGQKLEIPYRNDGNLSWDTAKLVDSYIEVYKIYRKNEKLSEVYWMLFTAVKRIDPELLDYYKGEIKKFDRDFARGLVMKDRSADNRVNSVTTVRAYT